MRLWGEVVGCVGRVGVPFDMGQGGCGESLEGCMNAWGLGEGCVRVGDAG